MKLPGTTCAVSLLPATLASLTPPPRGGALEALTDEYLFEAELGEFMSRRAASDPPTVIWASDGCTLSPDNPLGFGFEPACNRHDFGYLNYRHQGRFTGDAKATIDSKFLDDLNHQCSFEFLELICKALAEVYHAAVERFGGGDATGRADPDADARFEERLAIYNEMLVEATVNGMISS